MYLRKIVYFTCSFSVCSRYFLKCKIVRDFSFMSNYIRGIIVIYINSLVPGLTQFNHLTKTTARGIIANESIAVILAVFFHQPVKI